MQQVNSGFGTAPDQAVVARDLEGEVEVAAEEAFSSSLLAYGIADVKVKPLLALGGAVVSSCE
jgi:hypothetical protein